MKKLFVAAIVIGITHVPVSAQKAPRTPWGDPDLQGSYTNLYEDGTPLERPAQFLDRTLDQVQGEELAKLKLEVQSRTINNFEGPIHAPNNWWQDALDLRRETPLSEMSLLPVRRTATFRP